MVAREKARLARRKAMVDKAQEALDAASRALPCAIAREADERAELAEYRHACECAALHRRISELTQEKVELLQEVVRLTEQNEMLRPPTQEEIEAEDRAELDRDIAWAEQYLREHPEHGVVVHGGRKRVVSFAEDAEIREFVVDTLT